jgi:hypothetical protein
VGIQFIQPTEKCWTLDFVCGLELAGYELVDAFSVQRRKYGKPYSMVRFVFARKEYAEVSSAFMGKRLKIMIDLYNMCARALWRVRAYDNPYYMDDHLTDDLNKVSEERTVSVNLEAREPLYLPDGQQIRARLKDEEGHAIGEPVPIAPSQALRVVENEIKIVNT